MDFRLWSLPVLALLGCGIFALSLQELYAYRGIVPISFEVGNAVLAITWLGLAATIYPREMRLPSDLFLVFYVIVGFLWGALLWPATGLLSIDGGVLMMVLLYLPALAVVLLRRAAASAAKEFFLPIMAFRREHLHVPLLVLLAIAGVVAFGAVGDGGFGIDSAYDRRLGGRDALSGQMAGYALNMAMNGGAPLLAFIAGWRRKPMLLFLALCFAVFAFWLLGLKSLFVYVPALAAAGFALRLPWMARQFPLLIVLGLIVAYGIVCLEVSDGSYSLLADYVVRRVSMVQPQVQSYYLDAWLSLQFGAKLVGAPVGNYSDWTFMIGESYLNNPATNANTNAFFYALLKSGLIGYAMAIIVVALFMVVLDAFFVRTGMPEFFAIAGLFGVLISEQAYTTALLSSGVFLCLALVTLFSYPSRRSNTELDWNT
ncbi:MAG: hypothetical protein JJ913_13955 [Rhizobiaceae bacterium]|nr:hypothetical protein [Rhizobiaceae bacterium]